MAKTGPRGAGKKTSQARPRGDGAAAGEDATCIPLAEYAARRARVLEALDGAAAVVFAGEHAAPELGQWRPDLHFYYLTGLDAEPRAAVFFDPSAVDPKRRCVLLLGQEGPGLSEEARAVVEVVLHIRQFGSTRSINAGAASAIAMHEWVRRHAPTPEATGGTGTRRRA